MELTARAGWAARAVLYLVLGALAARIPGTGSGGNTDQTGAFATIADSTLGGPLLAAVATGLAGFAVWRAWSALRSDGDVELLTRIGWGATALLYAGLSALAIGVLTGSGGGSGGRERGSQSTAVTARVLDLPGGRLLVGAAGLAIVAVAVVAVRKGIQERFLRDVDVDAVPDRVRPAVSVVGTAGWLGRALVWGISGFFVVRAAVQHDPSEPVGLDRSLRELAGQSWGELLVWLVVAGFFAYGLLCIATTIWPDPDPDSSG